MSDPARAATRSTVQTILKWVAGITAVLSLVFGLQKLIDLVFEVREQKRTVAELREIGTLQQNAADYLAAWASFSRALEVAESGGRMASLAGRLGRERAQMRVAQEDLAMLWLQNTSARVSQGETLTQLVEPLVPALTQGIVSSNGARKADLLAHLGWANFLRWRDGQTNLDPVQQYRAALAADSTNPYAHAYLGHWQLWNRNRPGNAQPHFAAALASGRAREFVRSIQLSALVNLGTTGDLELLRAVMAMQAGREDVPFSARYRVFQMLSSACRPYNSARLEQLLAAHSASELVKSLGVLFKEEELDASRRRDRDVCIATIFEAGGQREDAARTWAIVRDALESDDHEWRQRANDAIARLSGTR